MSYCYLVVYLLFMMILMLNLLIALMVESYETVASKGMAQWQLEQASIMTEGVILRNMRVAPFVHILMYSSDVNRGNDADGDSVRFTLHST
jgi:hypothetical protein